VKSYRELENRVARLVGERTGDEELRSQWVAESAAQLYDQLERYARLPFSRQAVAMLEERLADHLPKSPISRLICLALDFGEEREEVGDPPELDPAKVSTMTLIGRVGGPALVAAMRGGPETATEEDSGT